MSKKENSKSSTDRELEILESMIKLTKWILKQVK